LSRNKAVEDDSEEEVVRR
jgi:DNA mismatch repair protein MSH6